MGFARSGLGVIVMTNKRFSGKWYILAIIFSMLLMNGTGILYAAQQTLNYDFLAFSNISAEQGMRYLTDAKIGNISHLPDSPTVLITASVPDDLQKARIIKDLVDCKEEYAIKNIPLATKANEFPSNKQIMDNIGSIAIGNFSNPPAANGNARSIVDICNDNVIIIAPSRMIERIAKTINKLQNPNPNDIFANNHTSQLAKTNDIEPVKTTGIKNTQPNTIASLLTENVSKDLKEDGNLNQRITAPEPTAQNKPVQAKSNLLAANSMVDLSSIPNPDDEITLTLSDQLTLTEFIGLVGPYLKMDFMYNASDFSGQDVTINPNGVLKGRIKIRDLYNYLDTVLKFKGFVMTRGTGNLVIISRKTNALEIDAPITQDNNTVSDIGDSVRVDSFVLKNISTATAEKLINDMKLSIQINSIPETKTLIVTEYTSRMPRVRALLDMIDKPGEPKQFRYRQLQYTMSQTLAPKIQSLANQLGTVSITINTTSTSVNMPERPEKRANESDAAYQARVRAWDNEQRRQAAAIASSSSSGAPGEPAAPGVFLDSDERTNRILMIGLKEQLDEVESLIETLDVSQRDPRKLHIYKIEFLDAEEIMKKLEELNIIPPKNQASSDTASSRTTRTPQTPRITGEAASREPAPVTPVSSRSGSDTLEAIGEEPLVVLVASINSLLVNATEEQHTRIQAIIDLVDKERKEIPYKLYKIKNANPEHLKEILDQFVKETIKGPEDKIERTESKLDEPIDIVADPNTSSLIVKANKKNQDWIESLINLLDKGKSQVLIDVTLVQISKTDTFDYDLNLISSIPDLTNTSGLTSAILPGISSGASNLVQPMSRPHYIDFQSKGGQGTAFYGDKHINALLKLMEQKDYGRVMAKPKILVNDNQEGTISTTDTTYVTLKSTTPISSVSTTQQTNVPQFETGIKFEGYPAGITLKITPHISESDLLRLEIDMTRSDFGTITGDKPPDTTESNVKTTVTVPDSSTIILGGLLKMNQSKGGMKIPLLSEIPIVGSLFKSISNSDIQRNLYIFVKAEIIRPPDENNTANVDLERVSKENKEAFETYEKEFQGYKNFSGIKPKPMEPANVLDAQ
jgi:general secretion pathway protein D